jgi:primase-polymerase (primpol)-like protein
MPTSHERSPSSSSNTAVPSDLRTLDQWVIYRIEQRAGKTTKVPYRAASPSRKASATDPQSWASYDAALAAAPPPDEGGIGFVFTGEDPYVGVDVDNCLAGGELHPAAARLVRALDSYTEVSPSGTGVHVIVRGKLAPGRNRTSDTPWGGSLEVYDRDRYFCITGRSLEAKP